MKKDLALDDLQELICHKAKLKDVNKTLHRVMETLTTN